MKYGKQKINNMKFLEAAKNKKHGSTHKLASYYDAYDFHFGKLDREKKYNILEIGVQQGGGLWTLKEFFPNSSITGLDIDPSCLLNLSYGKKNNSILVSSHNSGIVSFKQHESKDDNIEMFIGSQSDEDLLEKIHKESGPFDIIIDDGGHTMKQQQVSFFKLFPLLQDDGLYVIEDLHTSYWPKFGGGVDVNNNMMYILKSIADKSTSRWASRCNRAEPSTNTAELDYFDHYIDSVHFHDSLCFIYKKYCTNITDMIENFKSTCIRV